MPLETASYISDLVSSNPAATDGVNQGDDHLRLIKSAVKATFPNISGAVTATHGALNYLTTPGFRGPNGDATAPSMSFASETSLGFYRLEAGTTGHHGALAVSGLVTGGGFATSGTGTFGTVVGALPAGTIMDFAGPTAPSGWVECDGYEISRTTFAQLFARIGTTWGVGDGSTTFKIPALASRYRRHRGNSDLNTAGAVGSYQSFANASHTHAVTGSTGDQSNGHTHTYSGTSTGVSVGHTHTYSGTSTTESVGHTHDYSGTSAGQSVGHTHTYSSTSGSTNIDHTHGVNLTSGAMSSNSTHSHTATQVNGAVALSSGGGSFSFTSGAAALIAVNAGFSLSTADISHTHAVTGNTGVMSANADHTHSVSGTTAGVSSDHTHTYSGTSGGVSASHTHGYSGTTSAQSGDHTHNYSGTSAAGNTGHTHNFSVTSGAQGDTEARPYSATVLTCIKLFD